MSDAKVIHGKCVEVMRTLEPDTFDIVLTDPPYGIGFMGHEWDQPGLEDAQRKGPGRDYTQPPAHGRIAPRSDGAMEAGKYDQSLTANRAFQAWCEEWARECLRVLKPGGYLLSFGSSRTSHRLAAGIEDAGFELRDTIMWLYGSGFPKSMNISKAIDRRAGVEREVIGTKLGQPGYSLADNGRTNEVYGDLHNPEGECEVTAPATPDAVRWDGWGTALKPAHEPIVVGRKPFKGTVIDNVLERGTGALNINATRVPTAGGGGSPAEARRASARKSGHAPVHDRPASAAEAGGYIEDRSSPESYMAARPGEALGRWPTNLVLTHDPDCNGECVEGCPVLALDDEVGVRKSGSEPAGGLKRNTDKHRGVYNAFEGTEREPGSLYGDEGGVSRYFPTFHYEAKAGHAERNAGLDDLDTEPVFKEEWAQLNNPKCELCDRRRVESFGVPVCECEEPQWAPNRDREKANFHPTVKPIDLMRWLVRLVAAPGAVILDPFVGSGTTLCAAVLEDVDAVGIEREAKYLPIIEGRVKFWRDQPVGIATQDALDGERRRKAVAETGQMGLL